MEERRKTMAEEHGNQPLYIKNKNGNEKKKKNTQETKNSRGIRTQKDDERNKE